MNGLVGVRFILILFFFFLLLNSERERLSHREELWQQLESLAMSNPEWPKIAGKIQTCDLFSNVVYTYVYVMYELKLILRMRAHKNNIHSL